MQMSRIKIPQRNRDVRRSAFFRNFRKIALYIAYIIMWAFAYMFYLKAPLHRKFEWWLMLIFCAVVLGSGWLIFNVKKFVSDRSIKGRIETMKMSRTYGRGVSREGRIKVDYQTLRILKIREANGKCRKLRFQLFDDGYDLYYREGDEVIYFRGTRYPLCAEAEKRGEHICVLCGVRVNEPRHFGEREANLDYCEACKKTLVRIDEILDRTEKREDKA